VAKKVREVIKLLEQDGWYLARQGRTSHRKFRHPVKPNIVVVSGNPGDDMAPGTYDSILKQSGLKR
jgi:predicted RNA binding protein YcfA (HicA-like mRNA interferase family)